MAFMRSITTVSSFTLISRVLGYVRELLIAIVIGAGPLSDVFFLALKLPNLFRRLFAEGAFNAAFVPIFSRLFHSNKVKASVFVSHSLSYLMIALISLVVFFEIFMPLLMRVIAPGFTDMPGKFELAVTFARITFPYILFISLAALISGVLNTLNKFAATTAAPILLNANAILALLLFSSSPLIAAEALAWSVPISGVCQLLWVYYACKKSEVPLRLAKPRITDDVRKLFRKMIPGIFGAGVYQFNMLISDIIASFIPTAISYLSFADRINQFPLSIIGATMGTVLLPFLSKAFQNKSHAESLQIQNHGLAISLFLSVPAAIALFILAEPIIQVLYQHGRFTPEATVATAACLSAFVLGLPAYVMVKVLSTNFFARGNTKIPVIVASISLGVNIVLNLIFIQFWSYVGIAIATALAYWVNCIILTILLFRHKFIAFDHYLFNKLGKIILNSTVMAVTLYAMKNAMPQVFDFAEGIRLFLMIAVGLGVYLGFSFATKTFTLKDIRQIKK